MDDHGPQVRSLGFVRDLLDVRAGLNGAMLEAVYRSVFLIAAIPWAVCSVLAFQRSDVVWGLVWALILGPAIYVVLVAGMRLALGFFVMLLRLMEQLIELPDAVDRLTAEVGSLRGDLGKIPETVTILNENIDSFQGTLEDAQFWRSPRRRRLRREEGSAPEG